MQTAAEATVPAGGSGGAGARFAAPTGSDGAPAGLSRAFIDTLRCPYTGERLRAAAEYEGDDESIRVGTLRSEAGEFPVIEGIARLLLDGLRQRLVELLARGRAREALVLALDVPFHDRGGAALNFLVRLAHGRRHKPGMWALAPIKRRLARVMTDRTATFVSMAQQLWSPRWAEWQTCRFATPMFLPQFALSHLVVPERPVLDFGSGAGQGAFLLSRESPSQVVCADYSFASLYLARRFFVPQAELICLDGDFPLPFASSYFGAVFSSDTLHFVDSKLLLAGEWKRVVRPDGVVVLPHLHNLRGPVPFGRSLSAEGYARLFADLPHRIAPEEEVVRDFAVNGTLDLARPYAQSALDRALNGFCLVAAREAAVLRRYTGLWEHRLSRLRTPALNPIYQVERTPDGARLSRRKLVNAVPELPRTDLLPDSVMLETGAVSREGLARLARAQPRLYAELARRLVVIDAPARFI